MIQYAGLDVFTDERGEIRALLPDDIHIHSVLYITGKAGAIRANHVHKKDTHYCYILKGELEYIWKNENEPDDKTYHSIILKEGTVVFTPAGEKHKFVFLTDGVFVAMATEPRDQKDYESDTTRISL